jgi:phage gp29-like protein
MRDLLGIPHPEKGDEVLTQAATLPLPEMNTQRTALNREETSPAGPDAVDEIASEAEESDFVEISDDILEAIQQIADQAPDFEAFKKNLDGLLLSWKGDKTALRLGIATFKAHARGDGEFSSET